MKKKRKMKKLTKVFIGLFAFVIVFGSSFAFLLYGPYDKFRNFLITTAMGTMTHQYLATWFYDDKTIEDVLSQNYVQESGDDTDTNQIVFNSYVSGNKMFLNKYEKEILTKDEGNDLYKLININDKGFRGYLVAVYDPSKVKVAVSSKLNVAGQMLETISKNNNAAVAMNASGFIDENHNSNGGKPHGPVIKNGKLISNNARFGGGGGIIGFNRDNKLVLSKMSAQQAINQGIRDAVDFGPFLIVNGKSSFMKGNGGWGVAPRTAIAQRQDGIVLFLVMDGRDYANGIPGADLTDVTEILLRYGAYNAANMDGGTSSGLTIDHKLVSKPVNGGGQKKTRAIPVAWIVEA